MELSLSGESNRFYASQEICLILWNPVSLLPHSQKLATVSIPSHSIPPIALLEDPL